MAVDYDENDKKWARIVEIYNDSKALHLLAEEMEPSHEAILAPLIQHRDTLDHLLQAKASELGLTDKDSGHQGRNLDKALGHAYRGFFEVADWLGIIIREKIINELKDYPADCIDAVLPKWYPEWRGKLDKATIDIATLRGEKDVGDGSAVIVQVGQYRTLLNELIDIWRTVNTSRGALIDWQKRTRSSVRKQLLIAAVVGALITLVFTIGWETAKPHILPAVENGAAAVAQPHK